MAKHLPLVALLAAFLLGAHCNPKPPPPPVPTGGAGGQAPVPVGGAGGMVPIGGVGGAVDECAAPADACAAAGCNLRRLGCPEQRTERGTPFAITCRDSAADGRPYPLACITRASTCDIARACR